MFVSSESRTLGVFRRFDFPRRAAAVISDTDRIIAKPSAAAALTTDCASTVVSRVRVLLAVIFETPSWATTLNSPAIQHEIEIAQRDPRRGLGRFVRIMSTMYEPFRNRLAAAVSAQTVRVHGKIRARPTREKG